MKLCFNYYQTFKNIYLDFSFFLKIFIFLFPLIENKELMSNFKKQLCYFLLDEKYA